MEKRTQSEFEQQGAPQGPGPEGSELPGTGIRGRHNEIKEEEVMQNLSERAGAQVIAFPGTAAERARVRPRPAPAITPSVDVNEGGQVQTKPAKAKKRKGKAASGKSGGRESAGSRRGIETLFRTAYDTHLTLHAMADNKARMMIQVNGLILSVLLAAGAGLSGAADPPSLASLTLFGWGAISLLFAVMAARPQSRRRSPRTGRDDQNGGGLLFFSEFAGMKSDEYVTAMNELISKPEDLYTTMSRNLHMMGRFLERKYALLRVAFGAMALGVINAALVWFGVAGRWPW